MQFSTQIFRTQMFIPLTHSDPTSVGDLSDQGGAGDNHWPEDRAPPEEPREAHRDHHQDRQGGWGGDGPCVRGGGERSEGRSQGDRGGVHEEEDGCKCRSSD